MAETNSKSSAVKKELARLKAVADNDPTNDHLANSDSFAPHTLSSPPASSNKTGIIIVVGIIAFIIIAIILVAIGIIGVTMLLQNSDPSKEYLLNLEISGLVVDVNNNPMQGVDVFYLGGMKVTSNSYGQYLIKENGGGVNAFDQNIVLTFKKAGFVPIHKVLSVKGGKYSVSAVMFPEQAFVKVDPLVDINANMGGASLSSEANSFIVKGTANQATTANISLTPFDPTKEASLEAFPGEFSGTRLDGSSTAIETFGFMKVQVKDDLGNALDLANGKTADITLPISPELYDSSPDTIPLWYFDDKKGDWIERGIATKVCENGICFYKGTIDTIASWWNCDATIENSGMVRVSFDISDDCGCFDPITLSNSDATLIGVDYSSSSSGKVQKEGDKYVVTLRGKPDGKALISINPINSLSTVSSNLIFVDLPSAGTTIDVSIPLVVKCLNLNLESDTNFGSARIKKFYDGEVITFLDIILTDKEKSKTLSLLLNSDEKNKLVVVDNYSGEEYEIKNDGNCAEDILIKGEKTEVVDIKDTLCNWTYPKKVYVEQESISWWSGWNGDVTENTSSEKNWQYYNDKNEEYYHYEFDNGDGHTDKSWVIGNWSKKNYKTYWDSSDGNCYFSEHNVSDYNTYETISFEDLVTSQKTKFKGYDAFIMRQLKVSANDNCYYNYFNKDICMPMEISCFDENQVLESKNTVTKISTSDFDNSIFTPPANCVEYVEPVYDYNYDYNYSDSLINSCPSECVSMHENCLAEGMEVTSDGKACFSCTEDGICPYQQVYGTLCGSCSYDFNPIITPPTQVPVDNSYTVNRCSRPKTCEDYTACVNCPACPNGGDTTCSRNEFYDSNYSDGLSSKGYYCESQTSSQTCLDIYASSGTYCGRYTYCGGAGVR